MVLLPSMSLRNQRKDSTKPSRKTEGSTAARTMPQMGTPPTQPDPSAPHMELSLSRSPLLLPGPLTSPPRYRELVLVVDEACGFRQLDT